MPLVNYQLDGKVATITMSNGKANVFSHELINELDKAFTQAEADEAIVILTGQPGIFSAGFDLKVMMESAEARADLVDTGFAFGARLLSFPYPVIIACSGHAMAMGAVALLAADYRIGVEGNFKIGLNEVQIGMSMPLVGLGIARNRMTVQHLHRCIALAEIQDPQSAVEVAYLDKVVAPEELMAAAKAQAEAFTKLDMKSFQVTKMALNADTLEQIKSDSVKDREMILALPI